MKTGPASADGELGHKIFADLGRLFGAGSIAVVGASRDENKIGGRPLRYLAESGYLGTVHPVNPSCDEIQGRRAWPTVAAIDEQVDLALVAVPAAAVDAAIEDCANAEVPFAVVFSSGFAEVGPSGRARQQHLVEAARSQGVRLIGPNSLGIASASNHLVGSFATLFDRHPQLLPGRVGFVSQSGALGVFIYALAQDQGLGFSRFVSIGNESDLDVADMLAYLANDPETLAIGGYLESIRDGKRFLDAARIAHDAGKPMSFLKVGRSEAGRRAAESHTGSLAGTDAVYDAALRQAGIVRASDPQGLIDFLGHHGREGSRPARPGVAVLTISGGAGVWTADRLADFDVDLVPLAPETCARLADILPPFASPRNPVDATGQVLNQPEMFGDCLEALLDDPGVSTLIVLLGLQEIDGMRLADQLVEIGRARPDSTIVVAWLAAPAAAIARLGEGGIPVFDDLARCAVVVGGSIAAGRALDRRTAVPRTTDVPRLALGEGPLTEHRSKQILADLGVPLPKGSLCTDRDAAIAAATALGGAVVMKGQVRGIAHKTECGLVRVGVEGAAAVSAAYDELVAAMAAAAPAEDAEGVLVEDLVAPGCEVIVGCVRDDVFGFTVMFGLGGVLVEAVEDVVFRVAPIDVDEALAMIDETRGSLLLEGFRGSPPCDKRALAEVLARISEVAVANGDVIGEIELNPLRVYPDGVIALDALIVPARTAS